MSSLTITHCKIKCTSKVSIRKIELNVINVVALIFSQTIHIHLNSFRIVIRNIADNITLNIASVIHNNSCTILNLISSKCQFLGRRIISKLTLGSSSILRQPLLDSAIRILNNHFLNLITSSTNGLILGSGLIISNHQIIRELDRSRSPMLTSRTDLNLNKTHRHHTVSTRHGNRLILLQLTNSATTLTSQSSIILTIGNSSILQFIQSKPMCAAINTKRHNSLKTCNRQIINNNLRHIESSFIFTK